LLILAPSIENIEKQKRVLQRKLDRQRRANNPHKYNEDGTIKKDNKEKWVWSKNYLKTRNQLAELQRKIADKRKQDHQRLANWIITLGHHIQVEKMNFRALQAKAKETKVDANGKYKKKKRFGKSIANRAPSLFLNILNQKLQYEGYSLQYIDTFRVKASQYDHQNDEYNKKTLSQRWHEVDGRRVQRDLYSAFLIMNVKDNRKEIDRHKCLERWDQFIRLHDEEIKRLHLHPCVVSSMGI
ncbi:RNA-guided endonuclease TnpB family protein, partial [Anoxybacillus kestanbolensis]